MQRVVTFFVGFWAAGILFAIMGLILNLQPSPDTKACAREHNVYRCELIAVPVEEPK